MKSYNYKDKPIKIFGVPFFEKTGVIERLPKDIRRQIPKLDFLGRRCPGARVCFRTNSKGITVKASYATLGFDVGMSVYSAQSLSVIIGNRPTARFAGIAYPPNYETKEFENKFYKSGEMEDVTIFLPRNEVVADIDIEIADDAIIEAPTPYSYEKPIVYYGSSITEGGCASKVTNSYNAIISNHLNADYINFGFSGSARGELILADYFNSIDMEIFVFDYDHNAPDVEFLQQTHEPFFKRIREKNPDLPIVMMSSPDFDYRPDKPQRRDIVKQTYLNAVANGDKNVYYIDGSTFFGDTDRHLCTVDCIHPNDLGFYRMAGVIEPVIKRILDKQ